MSYHVKTNYVRPHAKASYIRPLGGGSDSENMQKDSAGKVCYTEIHKISNSKILIKITLCKYIECNALKIYFGGKCSTVWPLVVLAIFLGFNSANMSFKITVINIHNKTFKL